jgi:O-antigen ligase
VTLSDNSAKVHFQFFDLVQPVLDAHPVFGLGLNTFSVYYQFLTGKTNWGPHSFYIALLDETGLVGACVFAAFLVWVGIRLAVILRASRALERLGDPKAGEWRALAIGLSGGLAATLVANVFYLTMQFYYFYGLVLIVAAASALAVARVRRAAA